MSADGGPAFPGIEAPPGYELGPMFQKLVGMSLRDYFAAAALTGLCADSEIKLPDIELAESSYAIADAMLAEKERAK